MILNLTDLSDEPLQSQIWRQIREMILSGEIEPGFMLPSIRAFAREHKVSVITVQRAYENLERDGLIYSRRGKGFFTSEVEKEKKNSMSKEKFTEGVKPFILSALAEGLSAAEVKSEVEKIIKSSK